MDIEQLTKTQMLMLTLLVSFMTAIATGIVTVTLLDEAPPIVTNSINRVVERTVTRVPAEEDGQNKTGIEKVVERQTRVVVQEGNQIAQASASVQPRIVRLYHVRGGTAQQPAERFLSLGTLVSPDGLVLVDEAVAAVNNIENVRARGSGDMSGSVTLIDTHPGAGTALVRVSSPDIVNRGNVTLTPLTQVSLGQTALAFPGVEGTKLARGYIAGFEDVLQQPETSATSTAYGTVEASMGDWSMATGTPLISSAGRLIGIFTPSQGNTGEGTNVTVPFTRVRKQMIRGQQ
jgi:hypothetical protein